MSTASPALIAARRFGYGPAGTGPAEPPALLATLAGPDLMAARYRIAPSAEVFAAAEAYRKLRQDPAADSDAAKRDIQLQRMAGTRSLFARIADSRTPFLERLAWFWTDHFTVVSRNIFSQSLPLAFVDEAIRPFVAGRFADMLKAAVTHPAMLVYLDQAGSIGPNSKAGTKRKAGLNENLAREVLELHTLGAGAAYTQADVRQFAELLTGLTVAGDTGMTFRPQFAEPGAETVLGVSYGGGPPALGDILALLDDLAARPETARHLASKLAVHFVSDDPPADLVGRIAEAHGSRGDLAEMYRALLTHPAAIGPLAKVRQPLDFIGAGLRAMRLPGATVAGLPPKTLNRLILGPLRLMGQPFLSPPGPDGWPEETARWLTPQGIAQRIHWGLTAPGMMLRALPEPAEFAATALGETDPGVETAIARDESRAEAIGLVIASPAFNRR